MIVVHKGFDGLDVAFEARITHELNEKLSDAKEYAEKVRGDVLLEHNGIQMTVGQSGMKGGYRYSCDTGPLGAKWFFKKPTSRDPWGIRASVKSLTLAKYGMGWARHYLHDTLGALGTEVPPDKVSLGRVDYAVDLLVPSFELIPDHVISHARANRKGHWKDDEVNEQGRSRRYTSVTVGKNPSRQVIIYDKREEVLKKPNKVVWWEVWNEHLRKIGLPALDRMDADTSRIWRVELRGYKEHLKKRWQIRTWEDFDTRGGDMFRQMLETMRHTVPTADTNRSRWPVSPLWQRITEEVTKELAELTCDVPPQRFREVIAEKQKDILLGQFLGLGVSMAGLERLPADRFEAHLKDVVQQALKRSKEHRIPLSRRLEVARERYWFVESPE